MSAPAATVPQAGEAAPEVRFLDLQQIDNQLKILETEPKLRSMVAATALVRGAMHAAGAAGGGAG